MKRNTLVRMLCLALVLACLPLAALAYTPVPDSALYIVSNAKATDRLNLRAKPKTSAESLGGYYNGVRLEALSEPKDGWLYVRVEASDVKGYMQVKHLVKGPTSSVISAIPSATIDNKKGAGLNLRAGRSSDTANYGFFDNGFTVAVLGYSTTWCHVQIENQTGYMLTSGLSFSAGQTASTGSQVIGVATVRNPNKKDRLNLRESVDKNGKGGFSMGKYYSGVQVEILNQMTIKGVAWSQVRIGSAARTGFMQTDFLVMNATPGQVTSTMPTVEVKNLKATDSLHLRSAPDSSSQSLGKYANGTKVVVMGIVNDTWSHVTVGSLEGFMMNQYLSPKPDFSAQ